MGVLDNIRGALGRGLDIFRGDLPQIQPPAPAPQPAPAITPAAVQVGGWGMAWIDNEDFSSTGLAWRPGEHSALAQVKTPETAHFRIVAQERRIRIYLRGQKVVAGQNLGAPASRNINLPFLIQTPQGAPTLPSTYHPDVAVWARVGSAWQPCVITAINYSTGDVTFTEPAGVTASDGVEIYYMHADGQFRLRVARDAGGVDDSAATVFNQSFSTMHSVDQNNLETMIAWPQQVELVPGTRLVLEVFTTQVPMVWNDRAGHYIQIAALGRRIEVLDKGRLQRLAELEARGGL
jgi:hypothetical protein